MIGIVFDGGGVKGSYQVGAYFALKKCGVKPDIITGTSIGSFNGAMCASHQEDVLKELWINMNYAATLGINESEYNKVLRRSVIDRLHGEYKVLKSIIRNKGIDTLGLRKVISKYIDEDKLRKSNINFGLATLNLSKFEPRDVYIKDIPKGKLNEFILASAYLPVFKLEKIIDNNKYIDGGFYNSCPVNMCIDAGCDTIYIVKLKGLGYEKKIKKTSSKLVFIESKHKLGSVIFTNQERCIYNMNLGYYDTLKVIKSLDGDEYYFKRRPESTYQSLVKNVDEQIMIRLQKLFKTKSNRKLVIKSLEYVMDLEHFDRFKIYGPVLVVMHIQKLKKYDDLIYTFINQLKII